MTTTTSPRNPPRMCPECRATFSPKDNRCTFCCEEHRRVYHNRDLSLGGPNMILAKAWRLGRHKKGNAVAKNAFVDFCTALDAANAADKEAGRMPAIKVLENRYRAQGLKPENW